MNHRNNVENVWPSPDRDNKSPDETNENFSFNSGMSSDLGFKEQNWNLEIYADDEPYTTPVEILSEFLSAFMSHDYESALHYCTLILQYEPDNKIIQDFYPLIQEKIHFADDYESDEFHDNERSHSSSKSDNSTEYFSSTPDAESTSMFSSFSSEEETSQNGSE